MPEVIFDHTFARFTRAIGEVVRLVIAVGALLERQRWLIGPGTVLDAPGCNIRVRGPYRSAVGVTRGAKPTVVPARGFSKDHRPDLLQLVYILTVTADGAVPIAHRVESGNVEDSAVGEVMDRHGWRTVDMVNRYRHLLEATDVGAAITLENA